MKISIIVPVYNVEDYVGKCLESLVNQNYDNYEIIVVDDGSKDNSSKIIKDYQKKYPDLVFYFKKENGGLSSARNYGIKKSTGDYLLFIDSDDYIELNTLELLVTKLKKEKSDIIVFDMNIVYPDKSFCRNTYNDKIDDNIKKFITGDPSACNKLFKKELFTKNKIEFMENVYYEDLATIPLLGLYADNIAFLSESLYNYVQRDNSIINQKKYNKKMENIFVVMNKLSQEFEDRYIDELEYLYITHLLRTFSMRFVIYPEAKDNLIKINDIIRAKYPNFNKNKYYKMSSFKYKLVCYLAYHKMYRLLKFVIYIRR